MKGKNGVSKQPAIARATINGNLQLSFNQMPRFAIPSPPIQNVHNPQLSAFILMTAIKTKSAQTKYILEPIALQFEGYASTSIGNFPHAQIFLCKCTY